METIPANPITNEPSSATDYYQGKRPEMQRFLPIQAERVLEIGCGRGGFSEQVESWNEYWGVEPFATMASEAKKVLTKVLACPVEYAYNELPNQYFDLVICNDVIEHMVDHHDFLKRIQTKIKPGGHIVGSIPNVRYFENLVHLLWKRDWEYQESGILDRTHLRFFTQKSLLRDLQNAELHVEAFKGINHYRPPGNTIRRGLVKLLIYMLGRDMMYLQFGFRARVNGPHL